MERQNKEKNFQFFLMEDLKRKISDLFSKAGLIHYTFKESLMKEKYLKEVNVLNDVLFKALMCHERNRTLVVDVLHTLTGIAKESLYHAT